MITAHLKLMPPPPSQVAPGRGIPPLLDYVILKLVAKKREDRYRDTAELRVDLARLMRGETAMPLASGGPPPSAPGGAVPAMPSPVAMAPSARPQPATDRVAPMPPPRQGIKKSAILLIAGLVMLVAAVVVILLLFVLH